MTQQYYEEASKEVSVNTYERNADARATCIEYHGYKCAVCPNCHAIIHRARPALPVEQLKKNLFDNAKRRITFQ